MHRIIHRGIEAAIVGSWVAKRINGFYEATHSQAIGLEKDGRIVAGVIFENYNGKSIVVHIAIEGRITPLFLWAIGDYAFNQLGIYKVIAPVHSDNWKAVRLVEHLGFTEEARLRDTQPNGDSILFTIQKPAYRFLELRRAHAVA